MSAAAIVDALLARLRAPRAPCPGAEATMTFNPALARALALDPAVSALLGDMSLPMAIDAGRPDLFRVTERGTLLLSPALLSRPALLGVAVRWAQEAAFLAQAGVPEKQAQAVAARYAAALIGRLAPDARAEFRQWPTDLDPSDETAGEFALPVEDLLEMGGDARIVGSRETGVNRYGAASRPRPEAVHFSSSTASSVSAYVFAALDRLRRATLAEILSGRSQSDAVEALADAIGMEILRLHDLTPDEADVVLAPSGTDTEWLAVLMSLAADTRLANVLVAPLETGRAVKIAAAGLYFQEGPEFARGAQIWPQADIDVSSVSVRGADGRLSPRADIEQEIARLLHAGLHEGHRALLHVVLGSKTGIHAPSPEFVARLAAPGERIDVVADSCQGRYDAPALGRLVREGWMAQISGSKFFTGPPFSGALLLPARFRSRREAVWRLLAQAPKLAETSYWPPTWREGDAAPLRSVGPLLRWTGALIEASLFSAAAPDRAREAFAAFSAALTKKLATCRHLVAVDPPESPESLIGPQDYADFAGRSILCFAAQVREGQDGMARLDLARTERLFRWLNDDVEALLPGLDFVAAALARQPMHIGQPVDLAPGSDPPNVILRLVIGARFFSTVAMAGVHWKAALDAEIADAERALDKAELLLSHWRQIDHGSK